MISCLRPSNRSRRLTLPLGPSNSYFFSTVIHGIRRRSAASASRERVKAFSFTRSRCRAASHSCCDTTGGFFKAICSFELFIVRVDIFHFSFSLALEAVSAAWFFLRNTLIANVASPPVETALATTSPTVAKQNGHHIVDLSRE